MIDKQKAIAALEDYRGKCKGIMASTVAECVRMIREMIREMPEEDEWIPVTERLPENGEYILVCFENFSLADIGRYEEDELGGAFYPGDDDKTYVSYDLFVKAWMPLPEPPKEGKP